MTLRWGEAVKTIPLSKGKEAIVDDEWYPILSKWVWHCSSMGYAVRKIGGRHGKQSMFMHRYIKMAATHRVVDHVNGNRLDNREQNLREVMPRYNYYNRGKQANNTTGYKGVCYDKSRGRFMATISKDRLQRNLGRFDTAEEAAMAYDAAARDLHGKHARLNFPQQVYPILKAIADHERSQA